jgi:hypothetical protein
MGSLLLTDTMAGRAPQVSDKTAMQSRHPGALRIIRTRVVRLVSIP